MTSIKRVVAGLLAVTAMAFLITGCGGGDKASPATGTQTVPAKTAAAGAGGEKEAGAQLASTPSRAPQRTVVEPPNSSSATTPPKRLVAGKTAEPAAQETVSTVKAEPANLNLGAVSTNEYASGTVKLVNIGEEPVTIKDCKTSCGCTTTSCPKGQELQPGESAEVNVRISGGALPRRISKTVTFIVENQAPLRVPVSVEVISYVTVEPSTLDAETSDGRIVVKAADGQPFHIVSLTPFVADGELSLEAATEHVVVVDWELWRQQGQSRRLTFKLDHPKTDTVRATIRPQTRVTGRGQIQAGQPDRDLSPIEQTKKELRDQGGYYPSFNEKSPAEGRLAVAIRYGDVAAVHEALQEPSLTAEGRNEALALAARKGKVEIMAALIEAGADVKATDPRGRTPLMSAIQSRNAEAVRMLLAHGADVNAKDELQGTALSRAAGPFGDAVVVTSLIEAGADVNALDSQGQTPLIWAVRFGDAARVEKLVKAGADVSVRDKQGLTAMDYARNRASGEAIVVILEPLMDKKAKASG